MPKSHSEPGSALQTLRAFRKFLDRTEIRLLALVMPIAFALFASIFEGASLALLIPTIDAVINQSVSSVRSTSSIHTYLEFLPASWTQSDMGLIKLLLASIVATTFLKVSFLYVSDISSSAQVVRLGNCMRTRIYERYLSFGKLYFEEHNLGRLYQTLTVYTDMISTILRTSQNAAYYAFTLAVYLGVMFWISWRLSLIVMLLFPILHYGLAWLIEKIKASSRHYTESYNSLGKNITNSLSTVALVKSYSLEERELEWFSQISTQVERLQYSIAKKQLLIGPLQEIILLFFLLVLMGIIAVVQPPTGTAQVSSYAVFLLMLRRGATNFSGLNSVRARFAEMSGPLAEIMKVFDDREKHFVIDGTKTFHELESEIAIKDLSFSYARGSRALRHVNLSFRKNQTTALVGQTGSGKTTLVNLLMRFYDCPPDSIFVDGVDIREFTLKSWRAKIAVVSQDAMLFHGSFRDNLVYGLDDVATEQQVISALEKSRLLDLVMSLPDGLETEIGDHGVKLSGGERQRLSIARAFLKNADILIMDEPTSALDSRTESLIQEDLDLLSKGKTVIMIAHRLATIKNADHIVVLESGQVVEQGSSKELLAKRGAFFEYWGAQQIA